MGGGQQSEGERHGVQDDTLLLRGNMETALYRRLLDKPQASAAFFDVVRFVRLTSGRTRRSR